MHELEKQALEDPFLADALEGYAGVDIPAGKHLSILQTQLQERIAQNQENKNVFHMGWQRLSVAAAACILFVTATMLFWIRENQAEKQLASQPKQVDVSLSPLDTDKQAPLEQDEIISEEKVAVQNNTSNSRSAPLARKRETAVIAQMTETNRAVLPLSVPAKNDSVSKATRSEITSGSYALSAKDLEELAAQSNARALQNQTAGVLADSGTRLKIARSAPKVAVSANQPTLVHIRGLPSASQPSTGWELYNNYLKENIRKTAAVMDTGSVVLSFTVSKDGKPVNIKVDKGLNEMSNLEAIRLVAEGPLWIRGQDSTASARVYFTK